MSNYRSGDGDLPAAASLPADDPNQMTPLTAGLDLGGTTTAGILLDVDGQALSYMQIDTEAHRGHNAVLTRMGDLVHRLLVGAGADIERLQAVGIGLPGMLDLERGVTKFLPNLPGAWPDVPVVERMEDQLDRPVFLLNDVRSFTLGELTFGAGRGIDNLLCVSIGTGIGGGLAVGGKLHLGLDGTAGEVGHQTIVPDGPRCGCGNAGCLEALASGPAIAGMGMKAVRQGLTTMIRDLAEGDLNRITPALIHEAAESGDEVAAYIYERSGTFIGIAVANLITVLSPQMVIVGGGVAQAGDWLLDPIRRTVRERARVTPIEKVHIVRAALGMRAGVMGAAEWARQNME